MTEGTKTCPDCGQAVKADAVLCRHCRYDFKAGRPAAPVDDGPVAPRKSSTTVVLVVVLVLGLGIIPFIAIIAAIAIPGLLASQRASNERNASASLKTLATAEADFRANDRDGNRVNDFWVGDVAGLYGMTPVSVKGNGDEMLKLIELSIAGADFAPLEDGAAGGEYAGIERYATPGPKAGYHFAVMEGNAQGKPYHAGTHRNEREFGFSAFPATRSSGKSTFILNEDNTIFKRPSDFSPVDGWPADDELRMSWSKLD